MLTNLKQEVELLRRHVKILKLVKEHQPVGIIKLAEISGLPQHKVRYSLRVLEKEGIIKPSPAGAMITSKAEEFLKSLDREIKEIKQLLEKLG